MNATVKVFRVSLGGPGEDWENAIAIVEREMAAWMKENKPTNVTMSTCINRGRYICTVMCTVEG